MIEDLKPYSQMKDSGVPWLGEVPEHWAVERLKSATNNVIEPTSERRKGDFYIALEHVESWTGQLLPTRPDVPFDSQVKRFRLGDVLFGKLRPYLAKVIRAPSDGVCVAEFLVLRPSESYVCTPYVEKLLRSKPIIDAVNSSTFGAKMPRADWQFMGSMSITLPPLPEQAAIVRFLDHADRRIRRYIRAKQKLIKLLEELKAAIIHRAVTRGLDPNVRLKPSGVEWLWDVPEHWEVVPFKRRVGFQEGPGIMAVDFRDAGIPLLRISCLRGAVATLNGCNYLDPEMVRRRWSHFEVRAGDYLLSASASTGSVVLADEVVAGSIPYTGIIRLWAISDQLSMPYMRLYMGSAIFQDQIGAAKSGVAIEHFGPTHLKRMWIALPPLAEQRAITDYVEKAAAPLAAVAARYEREITLLREYRTRLIADVVTGKLDVREAAARFPEETEEPEPLDEAELEADAEESDAGNGDALAEEAEA